MKITGYQKLAVPFLLILSITSCDLFDGWMTDEIPNQIEFHRVLSAYDLFEGEMFQLEPKDGVYEFELSTPLFTDYAKKQRLIKLPPSTTFEITPDGKMVFPDSTLIAKTFYYPPLRGKKNDINRIIETRLLQKVEGRWNVAVYRWDMDLKEARLVKDGGTQPIDFALSSGENIKIEYQIPTLAECTTCHQSERKVIPIGTKVRNLNISVERKGKRINQLQHFKNEGLLTSLPNQINTLPNWADESESLNRRSRAYLDVNCSHCHGATGFANQTGFLVEYERPFDSTGISTFNNEIIDRMRSRWKEEKMPLLGTTIIHEEGVELLEEYLKTVNN